MKSHVGLFVVMLCVGSVMGQDPQFTQFYAAPLYLNPAFAGATFQNRIVFNNRYQWVGLPRAYVTYATSFDHNFDKLNSGVGVIALVDRSGTGYLTSTTFGAIYAYKFNLTSRWVVRTGLQFSYASRNIDFYKLTFGDQLDKSGVNNIVSAEQFDKYGRKSYFDFNSGIVIHSATHWIGFTARHLNQPDQSLMGGDTKSNLPIYYSIHGGTKIFLDQHKLKKSYGTQREKSITPTFLYKGQGDFHQLDLGMYVYLEPLVIGLWYRGIPVTKTTYDAVAVLLGLKWESFTVGYSYDLTVSRLNPSNTAGSHEISLSVNFPRKAKPAKKRRKDYVIPCPKF